MGSGRLRLFCSEGEDGDAFRVVVVQDNKTKTRKACDSFHFDVGLRKVLLLRSKIVINSSECICLITQLHL